MFRYISALVFIALMASCSKQRNVMLVTIGDYKIEGHDVKPQKHNFNAPYQRDEYNWLEGEMKIGDKVYTMDEEGTYLINNSANDLIISSLDAPTAKAKEALSAVASATSLERAFQEIELNNTGQEDVKMIDRIPAYTVKKITKNTNARVYGPRSQPPSRLDLKAGEQKPLLFQIFDLDEVKKNFKKDLEKVSI